MLGETDKIIDKICSKHTPPDGVTLDPTAGYGRFYNYSITTSKTCNWNRTNEGKIVGMCQKITNLSR